MYTKLIIFCDKTERNQKNSYQQTLVLRNVEFNGS